MAEAGKTAINLARFSLPGIGIETINNSMKDFHCGIIMAFFYFIPSLVGAQAAFEDMVYEENIQAVRIYPKSPEFSSQMASPVIALNASVPLVLEFDDIAYEADMYSAKIIHCNADWTQSGLKSADYLQQFNEFNVNEYQYSLNTRIPYIHFTFQVPPVNRSGNYILKVYRGRNEKEVIISKKFMVVDNQVTVGAEVVPPSRTADRLTTQQINFNVNHGGTELMDPKNNVMVVIRQNQRWDNAIIGLQPTFIREDRDLIAYQLFDGSNTFPAGNEFRFIDLRYVRSKGRNIASVRMEEDAVFANTTVDQSRAGQAFLQYLDLNGQYAIFNVERQNPELESEFVLVTFNLKSDPLPDSPYILGALSNWGKDPASKMTYHEQEGLYQATLLLKQGWYDYQFGLRDQKEWNLQKLEGNHFQTENEYEIFIYYRDMGSRYDELIGYKVLNPNKRRL